MQGKKGGALRLYRRWISKIGRKSSDFGRRWLESCSVTSQEEEERELVTLTCGPRVAVREEGKGKMWAGCWVGCARARPS